MTQNGALALVGMQFGQTDSLPLRVHILSRVETHSLAKRGILNLARDEVGEIASLPRAGTISNAHDALRTLWSFPDRMSSMDRSYLNVEQERAILKMMMVLRRDLVLTNLTSSDKYATWKSQWRMTM